MDTTRGEYFNQNRRGVEMSDDLDDYTKMYFTLKGEILALKLLLKECREWIEFMEEKCRSDENYKGTMYFKSLVKKIDNAIGEKK